MRTTILSFVPKSLLAALLVAGAIAASSLQVCAADQPQQLLEWRVYRLGPDGSSALLDAYLKDALVPALNDRGIKVVGVFTEPEAADGPAVWVLIPYPNLESVQTVTAEINRDPRVVAAGNEYLQSPTKASPAFARIDSWLMLAFAGMPQVAVPELTRNGQPRIFELRVYESFSELTALKKVEMFNAGEIEVMQEVGLSPVFYGQALIGDDLPHLAYLLCSPDRETHQQNWRAFLQHPTWIKLRDDPQYTDTVSKITRRFLVPTAYSQI